MPLNHQSAHLDLDAYFQRIGYTGDRSATLETLHAIHQAHTQSIAFENLNPLLKKPVFLDLESLQHKLIYGKRGGYCFEQNLLLRSVLDTLGFQVTNLAARVLWNIPEGAITPRSHMLLLVRIDGEPYIADVGFGGLTLTTPLALIPDSEQQTTHERFRLMADHHTYVMQASIHQTWTSLYRFDLQEQQLPDYEVSNWYVSTHPNSLFVTNLVVAKPGLDCRYALRNNQFVVHYLSGQKEQHILSTGTDLRAILEDIFKLDLSAIAAADEGKVAADPEQMLQQLINQWI